MSLTPKRIKLLRHLQEGWTLTPPSGFKTAQAGHLCSPPDGVDGRPYQYPASQLNSMVKSGYLNRIRPKGSPFWIYQISEKWRSRDIDGP